MIELLKAKVYLDTISALKPEIQRVIGSMFFKWDCSMYDDELDHPAQANTSDLNEELGQAKVLLFLFSFSFLWLTNFFLGESAILCTSIHIF